MKYGRDWDDLRRGTSLRLCILRGCNADRLPAPRLELHQLRIVNVDPKGFGDGIQAGLRPALVLPNAMGPVDRGLPRFTQSRSGCGYRMGQRF